MDRNDLYLKVYWNQTWRIITYVLECSYPHLHHHGGLAQSFLQRLGKWLPLGYLISPSKCVGWQLVLLKNILVVLTPNCEKEWDLSRISLALISSK